MAGHGSIDVDVIGSAGTLVAAGLETAGLHVQESILRIFELGMGSHLGLLLYMIAALAALLTIGLGGNYKFGLWFLFGPFLFYQLTVPRVPDEPIKSAIELSTSPSSWSRGSRSCFNTAQSLLL